MFFRLSQAFRRFMYGRYGIDALNVFIIILLAVIAAVNLFFHSFYVYAVQWVLFGLFLLRAVSKGYTARQKENNAFLKVANPVIAKIKLLKRMNRERDYRVFKKCPACKAVISLPRKKGKHSVKCPKCGNNFKVKI